MSVHVHQCYVHDVIGYDKGVIICYVFTFLGLPLPLFFPTSGGVVISLCSTEPGEFWSSLGTCGPSSSAGDGAGDWALGLPLGLPGVPFGLPLLPLAK